MPFAIQTYDKPNSAQLRAEIRATHVEYLKKHQHMLIAAGGLLHDDGSAGPGGILLALAKAGLNTPTVQRRQ